MVLLDTGVTRLVKTPAGEIQLTGDITPEFCEVSGWRPPDSGAVVPVAATLRGASFAGPQNTPQPQTAAPSKETCHDKYY